MSIYLTSPATRNASAANDEDIVSRQNVQILMHNICGVASRLENLIPRIFDSSSKIKTVQDYVNSQLRRPEGLNATSFSSARETVKEIAIEMINEICRTHLSQHQKILEIGAGKLNADGHSHLMQRLPQDIRDSVEPTEINRFFIGQTGSALKHADTVELTKLYQSGSVDHVIGSEVLDTLSERDLQASLQQMHQILKNNGLIVHFRFLRPFTDTIVSEYAKDDTICFPSTGSDKRLDGLQIISKKDLLEFLSTQNQLSTNEVAFLTWFANLPANHRELIINEIDNTELDTSCMLSKWMKQINPKGITVLKNSEFFEKRMMAALERAGFRVIEFGYRTGEHIIDRPPNFLNEAPPNLTESIRKTNVNEFELKDGESSKNQCLVLAIGKIFQRLHLHVIIAQKMPS